jgi:hypothetical protein
MKIDEAMRRRAFAVVVVVVAIVVALLLWRDGETRSSAAPTDTARGGPAEVVGPPATTATVAPVVGDADLLAAREAAQRFLAGYLRLTHGGGTVDGLAAAAPQLRQSLRRRPPRVTPAKQGGRTAILALTVEGQSPGSVRVRATVRDGDGPMYGLLLYLEWRGRRWLATRIGDA